MNKPVVGPSFIVMLVIACTTADEAVMSIAGGQVRCRCDPLAESASALTATATFATPTAIDGVLTDPAWAVAHWQGDGPAFAACCDHTNLYLAVRTAVVHENLQAIGPGEQRDGPLEHGDLVGIRLAPLDRQEMFIDLAVAPDATVADRMMSWTPDGVGRYYGGFTLENLQTGSQITDGCWTLELAIPWAAMWTASPQPGQGATLRLQVASRASGTSAWRTWVPSAGRLDEPPTRFGILVLGRDAPPWRAVQGDLIAGPDGRLLALALIRSAEAPAEAEVVVTGNFTGKAVVHLGPAGGRILLPIQPSGPAQGENGIRSFTVQAVIAGRTWPLGGWMLRDPLASEAGTLVVPGVGGEAVGLPITTAGMCLAALAIPLGRMAVDLHLRPLADGPGPWRLRVADGGHQLADLTIPSCPAVAAVPTASLKPGWHQLSATLTDTAGQQVLSAILPLDIVP